MSILKKVNMKKSVNLTKFSNNTMPPHCIILFLGSEKISIYISQIVNIIYGKDSIIRDVSIISRVSESVITKLEKNKVS